MSHLSLSLRTFAIFQIGYISEKNFPFFFFFVFFSEIVKAELVKEGSPFILFVFYFIPGGDLEIFSVKRFSLLFQVNFYFQCFYFIISILNSILYKSILIFKLNDFEFEKFIHISVLCHGEL